MKSPNAALVAITLGVAAATLSTMALLLTTDVSPSSVFEGAATLVAAAGAVTVAVLILNREHSRAYTTEHYRLRMQLAGEIVERAALSMDELAALYHAAFSTASESSNRSELEKRHAATFEHLRRLATPLMKWQLIQRDQDVFNAINEFGSKAQRSADMMHAEAKNGNAREVKQIWDTYRFGHAERFTVLLTALGRNLDREYREATGAPSWMEPDDGAKPSSNDA